MRSQIDSRFRSRFYNFHRKHRLKVISGWLILILNLNVGVVRVRGSDDWCYDAQNCVGPSSWPGVCNKGTRQSPINIPITKVTTRSQSTRLIVNRNYALPKLFFVRNTGGCGQGEGLESR